MLKHPYNSKHKKQKAIEVHFGKETGEKTFQLPNISPELPVIHFLGSITIPVTKTDPRK